MCGYVHEFYGKTGRHIYVLGRWPIETKHITKPTDIYLFILKLMSMFPFIGGLATGQFFLTDRQLS
jgi:hypothetical protein